MMKKIGICTLFTGYNVGSALQAYATKVILRDFGYRPQVIKMAGSVIGGRDIRPKKIFVLFVRMMLHSNDRRSVIKSFTENGKNGMDTRIIEQFDAFYRNRIKPITISYNNLRRSARGPEWQAFICGSDQVWNSSAFYVDPFYYLRFAPRNKRIAYAPSFGRSYIPKYNKKKIAKYLSEIDYLSIRETTGKDIIEEMVHKNAEVCLDPTLLLDRFGWEKALNFDSKAKGKKYVLCYFLNEPNDNARKVIDRLSRDRSLDVIFINKQFGGNTIYCGPEEFLKYISGAEYIVTDSFHGVAFSINFHKQFFVFDRQYVTEDQSTRIKSLLELVGISNVFEYGGDIDKAKFNYDEIDKRLNAERRKSLDYLERSLKEVAEYGK